MTAPPVLELRPDAVAQTSRLDLATVEAMMLWPNDETKREQWWSACVIEACRDRLDDMSARALRDYTELALNAPRLPELQKEANRRMRDGVIAGSVVLDATIYAHHAPERAAMHRLVGELCERLQGGRLIRPQTFHNTIRPAYRGVAHFWAIYVLACHRGSDVFPCRIRDLGVFLAGAEAFRARAEQTRVRKSPTPVMRPGAAVRLHDDLVAALPAVRLEIEDAESYR